MSLYYVQKLLFQLNRDERVQQRFSDDPASVLADYDLTEEERRALSEPDIGLLYVLGVNGQILMHYAAWHKFEWNEYLQAMRDRVEQHGPVRDGVYAMTGYEGVDAHAASLGQSR